MNTSWWMGGLLLLAIAIYFLFARGGGRRPAQAARRPEATTMLLREERLDITKHREELADVTTHREVVRENKTVTVPVTREELVVEKDGVETARIPLCEERVDLSTHKVELNDVSVSRREWEENRQVEAVLKKEVARVETTGEAPYTERNT